MNLSEISYDQSSDKILGSFNNDIYQSLINLYEYDDDGEMTEHYPPVINVTKFSDYHDFEHG